MRSAALVTLLFAWTCALPNSFADHPASSFEAEDLMMDNEEDSSEVSEIEPVWKEVPASVVEIVPQVAKPERKFMNPFEVAHHMYQQIANDNAEIPENVPSSRAPASASLEIKGAAPGSTAWTMQSAFGGEILPSVP